MKKELCGLCVTYASEQEGRYSKNIHYLSKEIIRIHDLCKSLTMYSRLKFLYQLKIEFPSLATGLKILLMCKKGEDMKEKDQETVKRHRMIQNKFRSNRKAAVFDSYSL